uniref:Ubiquitin-like domain-containing protein n=1 Tax=Anopheles minimus TaxID=112268 RepID=A0A182WFG5_9DIPT
MDVTLIVKASNQQCEDLTIKCEPSWTIRRLKGHLTEVYPGKPSTDEQKLIYSGQLLGDSVVLKDVLRQYDGQQAHTVHLVFTPKNSYYGGGGSSSSSSGSKSNANSKMVSNASTSAAGTGSSSSGNGNNSTNSNPSTSVNCSASSYERSSREGVNNGEEANGDGLRHRSVSQARSTTRANPRQSQFVEHTAALQNFMQHTYMQYLNQYINLINEQSNANALYSGTGLPGAGGSTETAPATINPLSGNQPFPAVPFVPIVQSTAMAGGFPNFAYYPCMASAPYGSGFPSAGNIPTPSSDANNASSVTVPSGPNHFLSSSSHPGSSGMPSTASGSQIPSPQIPGIVNPTATSTIETGDANGATTPGTTASGSETATVAAAEQGAPQDAAPAAAAAAAAVAPARARRFPNIVVEEQENNDWLDVFFSMCRVGILITAIDRRIPRLQATPDANAAAQREQQPAVAQPNNNVPEHIPEQQLPNEPNVGASGVESVTKTRSSETENATAGTSEHQGSSSTEASTSSRTVVPRPRTGSAPTTGTVEEEQQQQQTERINSDGEPAAPEQPAAEGQRMTFNDMTSFLGTLVITFFTSIIPDTPAA